MGLPFTDGLEEALGAERDVRMLVDGLYGTGLTRAVERGPALVIDTANRTGLPILALDVPSGLDCDSGEPLGACIRARVTATFAAMKLGFDNPRSRSYTGQIRLVGIGAPADGPSRP
jgi:NAD(P)H-hydrate epimerase